MDSAYCACIRASQELSASGAYTPLLYYSVSPCASRSQRESLPILGHKSSNADCYDMAEFCSTEDAQVAILDSQERESSINSSSQARRAGVSRGPPLASWRRFYITTTEGTKLIGTCLLCNEYIRATAGVSSNLLRHLKRKHPRELEIALKLADGKRRKAGSATSLQKLVTAAGGGDLLSADTLGLSVSYERAALPMPSTSSSASFDSPSTSSCILSDIPLNDEPMSHHMRLPWTMDPTTAMPAFFQGQPSEPFPQPSKFQAITNDGVSTSSLESPGTSARVSPSAGDCQDIRSRHKEINDAVLALVWRDLEPFEVVTRRGFQQLMKVTAPDYEPPTVDEMANLLLPRRAAHMQDVISPSIRKADSVAAVVNLWFCDPDDMYASVDVSYVTRHFRTETKSVAFKRVGPDEVAVEAIRGIYESALLRWNIEQKRVIRVLVDSPARTTVAFSLPGWSGGPRRTHEEDAATLSRDTGEFDVSQDILEDLDAFEEHWSINCSYQLLSAVRRAFDVDQDVVNLVAKCSRVVLENKRISEDVATIAGVAVSVPSGQSNDWTAQLDSLRDLCAVLTQHSDLQDHIYTCKQVGLTAAEVALLQDLLELLAPLEEATNALRQPHETVGLVLPALRNLQVSLTRAVARNGFQLKTMAEHFLRSLDTHFCQSWNDPVLLAGALLDPRFKTAWCDDLTACKMKEAIEKQRAALNLDSPAAPAIHREPEASKGGQKLFKNIRQTDSSFSSQQPGPATPLGQELLLYLSEETTEDSVTPLGYWKTNQFRFPFLAKLAVSVFAVCGMAKGVTSVTAAVQAARRHGFSDEQLEEVVLLRRNLP